MSRPGLVLAVLGLLIAGLGGTAGTPGRLPEDAEQEHGYYLRQLFGQYGHNGTLPFEGLARLLGSLGLGRVQVVQIQHEELGAGGQTPAPAPGVGARRGPPEPHRSSQVPGVSPLPPRGWGGVVALCCTPGFCGDPPGPPQHRSGRAPRPQCLNVTQLLVNFGLDSVAQLTPEQFTLLCPALLYQIDSRVCIQDPDPDPPSPSLNPSLGWGLLAVLSVSLPSALAVLLAPRLGRASFRSLLAFLVALAVGTLCGDALLHLWPHVGTAPPRGWHRGHGGDGIGDTEGMAPGDTEGMAPGDTEGMAPGTRRGCPGPGRGPGPHRTRGARPPAGTELRHLTAPEPDPELELRPPEPLPGPPHGHCHGPALPPAPAAADIVWMVVLGDGVHNLMDGLAIGAAFSRSLSSGLSTALAVLCHELPHELGDLAVLLRAGAAPRSVLLLNSLSALLSALGALAGAALGHSGTPLAPWLLTATAGIFLYVALADMVRGVLCSVWGLRGLCGLRGLWGLRGLGLVGSGVVWGSEGVLGSEGFVGPGAVWGLGGL
uniref:Solute carrier family 39 member 5 n=1 Tax=Catharus ustulatus TaxID=91951 RepID=A0A8C3Y2L3_CATUS